MPRETYRVSIPQTMDLQSLQRFATEINDALEAIGKREAALEGRDGTVAQVQSNLQMNSHRVCGLGRSIQDDEAVPRSELIEKALYSRRGVHRAFQTIVAEAGIRVPKNKAKDQAIPASQVQELVDASIPVAGNVDEVTGAITGAVTDGAMQDVPDPVDTPVDADALRDDLVANALPSIRNNIEEIHEKQDAIILSLQAAGLMGT